MYVTTHFEIHQSGAGAQTSNTSVVLLKGAFLLCLGGDRKQLEAGHVVDSTHDLCESQIETVK